MTVYEMRAEILKVYDTESWRIKVNKMYDDQVIAIYYDFMQRGILGKVLKKERPTVCSEYEQLSLFDLIKNKENN